MHMYETWESLETACFSCHNCPLGETRTKLVFGVGSRRAGVLLIGEGPGENEDLQGEPFVGRGGKLLEQVRLLRPKIIVCLGRISAQRLIDKNFRVTKQHGQFMEKNGVWMMGTYHPASLLRNPQQKPEALEDFIALREKIWEVCPETYEDTAAFSDEKG